MKTTRQKVAELTPDSRNTDITVKVVSLGETREVADRFGERTNKVAEATVGDDTGSVLLTLWNENIDLAQPGDVLEIKNGYVSFFRGKMRLNVGRYGSISKSETDIPEVNTENNMSEKDFGERAYRPRGYYRRRY